MNPAVSQNPILMKKLILFTLCLLGWAFPLSAQVGVNADNSAPDPSAMLDVKSTTRGVLIPRMTNAERDAIENPALGLIIYNTEDKYVQLYDGTNWTILIPNNCIPVTPDSIYGNNHPECNATGIVFSIPRVMFAGSYHWTAYPGAEIVSGQGTQTITVNFTTQEGHLAVRAVSGCGNSDYRTVPIVIAIPATPAAILGNLHPECNATGVVIYVDPVPGATSYHWTISSNASITAGQGTNSITASFGLDGGQVSVRAQNSCGNSDSITATYSIDIPAAAGSITGPPSPSMNTGGHLYFISPVAGATSYLWSVPPDATITSGQGNDSIVVAFGVQPGNVSVTPVNSCGNGTGATFPVAPFQCGDVVTDGRDMQTYPTVTIGTQCWMTKNMNIGTMISSGYPSHQFPEIIEKYCYNAVVDSCSVYGGLYPWDEAMQYCQTEGAQGICPFGWHIATENQWCTLANFLDPGTFNCNINLSWQGAAGGALKEAGTLHWASPNTGATNSSGFTALGAGYLDYNYYSIHYALTMMSSSLYYGSDPIGFMLNAYQAGIRSSTINRYGGGYSIRCLRD